jgi:hypothetical protein
MFTMSRSGLNDINAYLVICTNMGEVILYKGAPEEKNNEWKWQPTGRFEIPVPLNKDSFAIMEGDIIVATRNGLVSLMRVIFGQSTNVTQSLETRIKNLFSDYMFRMNEFKSWIKLFYNFKNRLLILNVPTQMPIPLNEIERGYEFTHEQALVLPSQYTYGEENFKHHIAKFIREYLYTNWINYDIFIQFNEDVSSDEEKRDGIHISFKTTVQKDNTSSITDVNFYIVCNGEKTNFFGGVYGKIQFTCTDFRLATSDVKFNGLIPFNWNEKLKKTYTEEKPPHKTITYYGFSFPKSKVEGYDEGFTVTDIMTEVKLFAKEDITRDTLTNRKEGEVLKDYTTLTARNDMSNYNGIADFPKYKTYNEFEGDWITGCDNKTIGDWSHDVPNTDVDKFFREHGSIPDDVQVMTKSVVECINHKIQKFNEEICTRSSQEIKATIEYIIEQTHIDDTTGDNSVTYYSYKLEYTIDYWYNDNTHTSIDYNYATVRLDISGKGIVKGGQKVYTTYVSLWHPMGKNNYCYEIGFGLDIYNSSQPQPHPWTFTAVQFNNDNLNFTDLADTWKMFKVELIVTGPDKGVTFFCGSEDDKKVFPWSSKTIDNDTDLATLNKRVGVYPFATFIFEKTPPPPPTPPPDPPPFPDLTATINNYWDDYSFKDGRMFRVSENFVNGALKDDGYNDTFRNLEKSYNELGEDGYFKPDDIESPLKEVSELFYNVTINFIKNSEKILTRDNFKEKGSTGVWTYRYDVYEIAEGEHLLTSMQYEIYYNYHYYGPSAEGDVTVATYSIGLLYTDNDPVNVLKGSITFITKGDIVDKISYKGSDTIPAFKFTAVPFDDFDDISLRDKHILIENAQWDLKDTSEVDIRDILIKTGEGEKPVFPFPIGTTIDELTDMESINKFYGWMFSNFGVYGGEAPPPLPPEPPRTIQKSINECWENDTLLSCDSFRAEHKFQTGELKYRSFNLIFEDLVELYNGAGTVTPDNIPNPVRVFGEEVKVRELIYNVVRNVVKNIKDLVVALVQGYGDSVNGTWTYGYDINEGETKLAHMEYEVKYSYNLVRDEKREVIGLNCDDYSITLKYTDNTKPSPEEQEYEFFKGTMDFSLDTYNLDVASITYSKFKYNYIDLYQFSEIGLEEKTVTIKNAQWKLEVTEEVEFDIRDILQDEDLPVFPTGASEKYSGTITDEKVAGTITQDFYGWMFSNFGFDKDNTPTPTTTTINEYFEDFYNNYKSFEAVEEFQTGILKDENKEYNKVFSDLEEAYKKIVEPVPSGNVPNPLPEVPQLFNKVAYNLDDNTSEIAKKLKDGASSGTWTYVYEIYGDDTHLASMGYIITYDYTSDKDIYNVTATYKIKLEYTDYTKTPVFTYEREVISGSLTLNRNDGTTTYHDFAAGNVKFDDFKPIDLEGKTITITNAQWDLRTTTAVDITKILTKNDDKYEKPVFPSPKQFGIIDDASRTEINKFYGWMFSNFAFDGGYPPPPPPPPTPDVKDTINDLFNNESYPDCISFKAEETFKTGGLKDKEYDKIFSDLASHYNGLGTAVPPIQVTNPLPIEKEKEKVAELFCNVVHNLDDAGVEDVIEILEVKGNSSGTWTYGYDINEGDAQLASMQYEVSYSYKLIDRTSITCKYDIKLTYKGYEEAKQEYELLKGVMKFYPGGEGTVTIDFTGFENKPVPFNSDDFKPINLEGKTVKITNAKWELKRDEVYTDITDMLTTGTTPVFPLPISGDIGNEEKAKEITKSYYGWMFSNFTFYKEPEPNQETKKEIKEETKPTSREVFKRNKDIPVIPVSRDSLGDAPPHVEAVKNTNFDLTLIPLLTGINILAPFRSSQYVMDSSYGTWSQWKDINMVDGIDHVNEFYFIIPQDFKPDAAEGGFIYNKSFLCKFNPEANGDFADMVSNAKPISVSYKTAATNFGNNNIKQISKIKLYGSASTFWGQKANYLTVTMHSDFFKNQSQQYQHTKESPPIREVLGLGANFDLRNLTYSQIKKYLRLYAEASLPIRNIEMGLICKPANRIALEVDMDIEEHNIIIYGYELYFKILNKL